MKTRVQKTYEDAYKVEVYHTEMPNEEANFAMAIIERFALVSAAPDGEDSVGRQQLKLMPVETVVRRAFDIARLTFDTARSRGLMVEIPDLNEVNAEADEKRAAAGQAKLQSQDRAEAAPKERSAKEV